MMGKYVKVTWPESQMFMELTEEEMDDFGIELGDDCSYFVPEEEYEDAYALAEERMRENSENERRNENPWGYGEHFN